MLWSVPEAEQTAPTVHLLSHIPETWAALPRPEGKLTFAASSWKCPLSSCPRRFSCSGIRRSPSCGTRTKQDATYSRRCPLATVTVATRECTQRSAFGSVWLVVSGGKMSHGDRGAEKVLLGKFLIGAEIFWVWQFCFLFFGESSNGTALLCVVFVQLGRWRPITTGYLCGRKLPSTWWEEGRRRFSASLLSHEQKWQRGAEPRVKISLEEWQKSFFSGTKSSIFNRFIPILKNRGFIAKGVWVWFDSSGVHLVPMLTTVLSENLARDNTGGWDCWNRYFSIHLLNINKIIPIFTREHLISAPLVFLKV